MDILVFLVILSVLVLVHELGHFLTARMMGVRVLEFGFGLPPRAIKLFEWKGTVFSLNWLPIGGYVRLSGEDADGSLPTADMFHIKPIWQRAVVLLSGVVMNFVLGVVLFGAVYSYLGIPTKTERVRITEVAPGSPAEEAGLEGGDIVGKFSVFNFQFSITGTEQLVGLINEYKGKEVTWEIERGTEKKEYKLVPRENPPAGQGAAGVVLSNVEMIKYPWFEMPFRGVLVGMAEAYGWGKEILGGLGKIVGDLIRGRGVNADVAGPIGIYQVSAKVAKHGLIPVLQFMGVLSVNLAVLNLMPFPGLDGGRIVFLGIEKLIGRERKNKFEGVVHTWGMIVLMSLMALITIRDVWRLWGK